MVSNNHKENSMNELPEVITRLSKPNKFDHYPQGTKCIVTSENSFYMQTSSDEENPRWEPVEIEKNQK